MWVAALVIVTLLLMLAVLSYLAAAARKLDESLAALMSDQSERLRKIERDLERLRLSLDTVGTGVLAVDIGQRLKK